MAVLPLSTSQVHLCSGIPFHSDYQHTRWFSSLDEQTAFFSSRVSRSFNNMNIIKLEYGYTAKLPLDIEEIRNINYLYFDNNGKRYYCFVTNLEYRQKGTTVIHFDIDYIQTYMFQINFKQSYVVREHPIDDTLNTNNEGLNYGDFYDDILVEKVKLFEGNKFLIIVSKKPLHDLGDGADYGDVKPSVVGVPQPLCFYAVPFNSDLMDYASGGYVMPTVTIDGGSYQTLTQPMTILKEFYKLDGAVNNIVSLYITEYPGFNMNYETTANAGGGNFAITNTSNQEIKVVKVKGKEMPLLYVAMLERTHFLSLNIKSNFRSVFSGHETDPESKLNQSPYAKIVLDDMKGNRVEYLPEYIASNDLILNVKGGLSHNAQIEWGFENYTYPNSKNYGEQITREHGIVNNKPSDIAIMNDNLASYMQGHRNSLKVKQDNIMINSLMGSFNGVSSAISGSGGNPGVAAAGSIVNVGQTAVQTQQEIKGLQAQLKDISNVPPSIQSMGANIHIDYTNKYDGIYIIYKQCTVEYRKRIGNYFKMYGYKTDFLKVPNITGRRYFNYVQTKGCNITGNFNNECMVNIKRIFDNGITLWHTDDVGNYNVVN